MCGAKKQDARNWKQTNPRIELERTEEKRCSNNIVIDEDEEILKSAK